MNYSAWYEKNHPFLTGRGLWLRGGELNTVPAAEFERLRFRVLITRLSTYRDTADSFTHTLLHQIARRVDGAYPDLAFLPPPGDAALFKRDNVPWLLGTTSKRGGRDFSVIAFSLSIVQELLNLRAMLETSGMPLRKSDRMDDPSLPLVILGGASALFTSVLFNDDPLVDGIFMGEDAPTIERLFTLCRDGFGSRSPKQKIFEQLCEVPGFFLPEGKKETHIFQSRRLPEEQLLESGPVAYEEPCIGTGHLQISEGCCRSCRFCAESFCRKPYREYDQRVLAAAALRQKAAMGVDDLELYSFNFSMHRQFYGLLHELSRLFPTLGLKSQRLDSFAADPRLVTALHAAGKTSITCGIEGISPRLRRYLHKELDEKDIRDGLQVLLSAPLRELKIFLLAIGLETDADFDALKNLLGFMAETAAGNPHAPRVIFSQTILVRFPATPLEFEDAPGRAACDAVLKRTGQLVRAAGFEFRASSTPEEYWLSQVLVRAGDERIGTALMLALQQTGFVYYREIPESFLGCFRKQLSGAGMDPEALLKGFPPPDRPRKPWSALATGVEERFLVSQWEAARKDRNGGCGCIEKKGAPAAGGAAAGVLREGDFHGRPGRSAGDAVPIRFRVSIEPALAGAPRKMRGVVLAAALMRSDGRLCPGYWGRRRDEHEASDWLIGEDTVTLLWDHTTAMLLQERMDDASFIRLVNERCAGRMRLHGPHHGGGAEIARIVFRSPFRFEPAPYFRSRSLKCTLRKSGATTDVYVLSRDSLKKNVLVSCEAARNENGGAVVTIGPGRKFDAEEFCRNAFAVPSEKEWVRIEMKAQPGAAYP